METPFTHKDHHHGNSYWASWCSPVGLGIFLFTAAIALYVVINLVSVIVSLAHPAPAYSYPSGMTMPAETSGSANGAGGTAAQ